MLFPTLQFGLFFAAVLGLHRALPPRRRPDLLLAASLLFYALWIPAYLLLLLAEIAVNYALVRALARRTRPRLVLAATVALDLGVLAWFKYAGLFGETLNAGLGWLGRPALPVPDVLLPLGISFFTFQILGLAVDAYRDAERAPRSLREYALFVSFFPQLVAGPILRGGELLPQIRRGGAATPGRARRGVWLLLSGLGKKVLLADFLLAPFADRVFGSPGVETAAFHLVALYSFAFQIYFDFSGYTDMARGLALLLGYELPPNFLEPYLARNPAEFWRRWHMTLSRWLRDYLYVPLGGNRRGRARTYANLLLTMLLGGLWHGASWNFLLWGGLHGLLLAGHRALFPRPDPEAPAGWRDAPHILLTFHAVCGLWVFFRAGSFADALRFLAALSSDYGTHWPWVQVAVVALCAALHVAERGLRPRLEALRAGLHPWWGTALEGAAAGAVLAACVAVSGGGNEFIYFQF
jgi:D-alanyl-lipoteichoic acid acyltransferase DltB (MBOAT superfamily)